MTWLIPSKGNNLMARKRKRIWADVCHNNVQTRKVTRGVMKGRRERGEERGERREKRRGEKEREREKVRYTSLIGSGIP